MMLTKKIFFFLMDIQAETSLVKMASFPSPTVAEII